jgi:hypothetical protein
MLLAPNAPRFRGPGTVFHGYNCAETIWNGYYGFYQNKAFSSDGQTTDPDAAQFLAKLENRKWQDVGMDAFPANLYRWQRLRKVVTSEGVRLVVCGKSAPPAPPPTGSDDETQPSELLTNETAIWAIADGRQLREGSLNFRARRLTRVLTAQGERIYAVGRFVNNNLVSPQWSVISITGEFQKVCFFWDDANTRYAVSRNTLESAGVDVAKLPPYLVWATDADQNAGGFWAQRATQPAPGAAYLELVATSFLVAYVQPAGVTMPYDPIVWGRFCPTVYDDGSLGNEAIIVQPGAQNAGDALAQMPAGSWAMVVQQEIGASPLGYEPPDGFTRATWNAIQVSDVGDWDATMAGMRKLAAIGQQYPNLWVRFDQTSDPADLTTYTHRLQWDRFQNLRGAASKSVQAVVLVTPAAGHVHAPRLEPCA